MRMALATIVAVPIIRNSLRTRRAVKVCILPSKSVSVHRPYTVEPLIMDIGSYCNLQREDSLSIKDTLRVPFTIILVHFNLQREDSLSIKDTLRVPFTNILVHFNLQREDSLSIKDTLRVPFTNILVHFNLQREDSRSIKDTLRVPFTIILVHFNLQREDSITNWLVSNTSIIQKSIYS